MRTWKKRGLYKNLSSIVYSNISKEELEDTQIYKIKGMEKAAKMIKDAIRSNINIVLVGDYDCDGIMASTIMYYVIKEMGGDIRVRLPLRFSEGYGLSEKIIDEVPEGSLLITVDNGIAANDAIKKAKEKDCKVLLTDHHLISKNGLPEADVIIDPTAVEGQCNFTGYCGAGIAYKLAKELISDKVLLKQLESLAGIATIADVMPLIRENRVIVKNTLNTLMDRKSIPAMNILLECLNLEYITAEDIGFRIGPIINASGRMYDDGAFRIFTLLTSDSKDTFALAKKAIEVNEERKKIQNQCIDRMKKVVNTNGMENDFPLVLYGEDIPEGIIGIVAGRFAEDYKTPCLVFSDMEDIRYKKGSARSYGNINLKELLDLNSQNLYKYGGHKGAAGMTILSEQLDGLREGMKKETQKRYIHDKNDYYDLELDEKYIPQMLKALLKFEPFGEHNPMPIFKIPNFTLNAEKGLVRILKSENGSTHLRLEGKYASCMLFNIDEEMEKFFHKKDIPLTYEIYGTLGYNYFNGKFFNQINLLDWKPVVKKTSMQRVLTDMSLKRY